MVGGFVVVGFAGSGWCMVVMGGCSWLVSCYCFKGERERERETYMNNKKEYLNNVVNFFFFELLMLGVL